MQEKTYTTAILTGGKSSRMGEDKAQLLFDGFPLLKMLVRRFSKYDTFSDSAGILISVGKDRRYSFLEGINNITYVEDFYDNCGPLGGLHALLTKTEEEWLFVTTVDLPLADQSLRDELLSYALPGIHAVVPIDTDGRLHPLCAIYHKSCLPSLTEALENKKLKVRDFLKTLRVSYIPVTKLTEGKQKLFNMNTPEDYFRCQASLKQNKLHDHMNRNGIPILSLAAYSGSGKTTFLERLVKELKTRKYRIAVLKHDGGHDFQVDHEGKDSWRFMKAGADAVILLSNTKTAVMEYFPRKVETVIDDIKDVDLILIEGFKFGPYPKLLLYRSDAGKMLALDPKKETPFMIISDQQDFHHIDCPTYGLNDIKGAADEIERRILL